MNNIDLVYQTIKELTDHLPSVDNEITYAKLEKHLALPYDKLKALISQLYQQDKIYFHKHLSSTGKNDYGEIIDFFWHQDFITHKPDTARHLY